MRAADVGFRFEEANGIESASVIALLDNPDLIEATDRALKLLAEFIAADTLFVSLNDGQSSFILREVHRRTGFVSPGLPVLLDRTYASLVVRQRGPVVIGDAAAEPAVADRLGVHHAEASSFVGVPVVPKDGMVVGTVCALDDCGYHPSAREIHLMEGTADLLAYAIDLEVASYRDLLTEAMSRKYLVESLLPSLLEAKRPFAFLFFDLDGFKQVNDRFGHGAGDAVLIESVRRLRSRLRSTDTVCRLGGDEFVAVLPDFEATAKVTARARAVLDDLRQPIRFGRQAIRVTASAGLSVYPDHGDTVETLVRAADLAMYRAKRAGLDGLAVASLAGAADARPTAG
jgi:diguanylate cyclase (GGDEF)-like protein